MRGGEAWGKGMVISLAAKIREGFLEEGPFCWTSMEENFGPEETELGK